MLVQIPAHAVGRAGGTLLVAAAPQIPTPEERLARAEAAVRLVGAAATTLCALIGLARGCQR